MTYPRIVVFFFFQAEDGIRDRNVTGVQTCALPISTLLPRRHRAESRKAAQQVSRKAEGLAGRLALAEIGAHQRRRPAPEQRAAQHIALLGWDVHEEPLLALPFFHHDRHPIPVEHAVRSYRGNGFARCKNPDEVQRIRAADCGQLIGSLLPARAAEQSDCLRQGVLLPREPAYEPAATDLA